MTKWWMIRAGDDNELIPLWRDKGIASIGWARLGNPKNFRSKEELMQKADEVYPEDKPNSRRSGVSQVWRFSKEVEKGDRIITFLKDRREYIIGKVTDTYFYDISIGNPKYPNHIRVQWDDSTIERDKLSQAAKNSLGSVLTVFRVDQWGYEIENLLKNPTLSPEVTDVSEDEAE